jgi:cell division ATPase FtsA
MTFHLAHIHDYQRFISIDIWSHRIRTAIYNIVDGQLTLEWNASIRQSKKNIRDGDIVDMRWVANTIQKSIVQASQKSDTIPSDMIIAFSSSEFMFDSVTTQYIRADKTSTISMEEIDTMIKKIESASFERVREKAKKHFALYSDDIRLVSSTITSIEIDGKKISNPIGFSGGKIRLTVLNVFAPASEFNIMRSIVASIDKNTISLVPAPIVFPKILDHTEFVHDTNCVIDIGLMHTTVMIISEWSLIAFETFSFGTSMLMEMLSSRFPDFSPLSVENLICGYNSESEKIEEFEEFYSYVLDVIFSFLSLQDAPSSPFQNLFLSGWIFENKYIFQVFSGKFESVSGRILHKERFSDLLDMNHDMTLPYWLGLMASDLLMVKKDPLVRILRYVLYNYE